MIEELTASQIDLPEFDELGRGFFAEAGFSHRFNPSVFRATWKSLLASGHGHILGKFASGTLVAVLGFVVAPDLNDGKRTAYETFWYSAPNNRGAGFGLIREYEKCAASHGANRISMVHLSNLGADRLEELYGRMGFKKAEVHYFKEVA